MPAYSQGPWRNGFTWESSQLRAAPRRRGIDPLRRLVPPRPRRSGSRARSAGHGRRAGAARGEQLSEFGCSTEALPGTLGGPTRGAPMRRPSSCLRAPRERAPTPPYARVARNAVRVLSEVEVELEDPGWTTPHIASRKSDMNRISSSPRVRTVFAEVARSSASSASSPSPWLTEKFARSKKPSPIPAYSQSTMPGARLDHEVRVQEIVVARHAARPPRASARSARRSRATDRRLGTRPPRSSAGAR